ncbi:DUF565 domain-containing protein [Oscillatoria sp. FACHB-1407]|uniref:DUF565 domain-containing protein n=1 Tax=Oscillatoria sp. FACHB-1407 TaxID=2692847 RepID=UPI0016899263|nr:DUF565 domain-containing protein [Oscillatoria sp. FACHB-1407]MBD2460577.1 DUF565 domain-containing protein [Oscillatoria sp. FACHB-1407]
MQNTRLNRIVDAVLERSFSWLRNPWRRVSLVMISVLFGNFLATAISTVSGQNADWDIVAAVVLVGFTEISSWLVYRPQPPRTSSNNPQRGIFLDILNGIKIGLIYGFFIEAFKLGS